MADVLLVEPDKPLAQIYVNALQAAGHSVTARAGAQAAISAADEHKPDIVILELQLVQHSGAEFLYEFRSYADWLDVPIIVLTNIPAGDVAGSRSLLYNELGVKQYLYKPHTNLRMLVQSVNELAPAT